MTFKFLRPAIALALALSVAGCGGTATFPVNVVVTGLAYPGLVLSTNGMTLPVNPPVPATPSIPITTRFDKALSYGEVYDVTIQDVLKTQPAHQTCEITRGGKDTAGRIAAILVNVGCGLNQKAIGGTITGSNPAGLVLTNGSTGGTFTALETTTVFSFANPVAYGVSYGVTVLTQPTNKDVCTVSQGAGIMGDDAIANIVVTCVAPPAP
jgi:hypothetical protein